MNNNNNVNFQFTQKEQSTDKVKATIPLTRRTLVPKGLQSRRANSFTNLGKHSQLNHSATALVARVHPDQSHGSA